MKLLLATLNRGKTADLARLLDSSPIEVLSLRDFPDVPDVEEDGETFLANARKKALAYRRLTGLPVLADDSGLAVETLGGEPGVRSARYGGEPADDARNIARLLRELAPYPRPEQRKARFVCVLVYLDGEEREHVTEGVCEGTIAAAPRGDNGFGYDPLFIHPQFGGRTMGEVTRDEKNSVSHRGQAFRAMRDILLASLSRRA
ncbi:MAG: RdgB/HAM1 family non-canonical purine NTP pyrophosphatase [Myxococcales bacterium]|nr:MAG: RdgB/HAM1 family non-canonical purine NTP pyrophosphatase [Myxococcales bacterium]